MEHGAESIGHGASDAVIRRRGDIELADCSRQIRISTRHQNAKESVAGG